MWNEASYSTLLASPFKLREAPADGLEPSLVSLTGSRLTIGPHRILQSAQRESNSHFLHGKQMGYHYTMGAKCITTKLSKINNAEASKEHRAGIEPASPRYDGEVLPLDHQCLFQNVSSGIGENRTHIARIKSPMHYLVCHNPMCCRRCFVQSAWRELNPRPSPYKDAALTPELHADA